MTVIALPQAVTIRDVAKEAEVSTATVSRVLAGGQGVSDELQLRVRQVVEALDYSPNQLARNLRRQATNFVGLLVTDSENPFFSAIMRGIQDVLKDNGFLVLTANSDEDPEQELLHMQNFRAHRVSGVIWVPSQPEYAHQEQLFGGMSIVAIDRRPANMAVDTVTVNSFAGAFAATQHLLDLEHRRIGLIAGPLSIYTAKERLRGYEAALHQVGIALDESLVQEGSFTQEGGAKAMNRLLDLPEPPTAVFSANNLMTLGALQAIHDRCLNIPDDIAIAGFDDMAWAASLQPPLTAVRQPTHEIGRRAALMLLERIVDPNLPPRDIVLETKLILRASTGGSPTGRRGQLDQRATLA